MAELYLDFSPFSIPVAGPGRSVKCRWDWRCLRSDRGKWSWVDNRQASAGRGGAPSKRELNGHRPRSSAAPALCPAGTILWAHASYWSRLSGIARGLAKTTRRDENCGTKAGCSSVCWSCRTPPLLDSRLRGNDVRGTGSASLRAVVCSHFRGRVTLFSYQCRSN